MHVDERIPAQLLEFFPESVFRLDGNFEIDRNGMVNRCQGGQVSAYRPQAVGKALVVVNHIVAMPVAAQKLIGLPAEKKGFREPHGGHVQPFVEVRQFLQFMEFGQAKRVGGIV